MVPMPASVNSSSSSTWGMRPSSRWAERTPPARAVRQASILGIMPPATVPSSIRAFRPAAADGLDERRRVVGVAQQAGHVGQVDDLLGDQLGGHGAGHRVGVDVERLAGGVGADGGDDGDEVLGQQPVDDAAVHLGDLAHEAQLRVGDVGDDEVGVLARQARRPAEP